MAEEQQRRMVRELLDEIELYKDECERLQNENRRLRLNSCARVCCQTGQGRTVNHDPYGLAETR